MENAWRKASETFEGLPDNIRWGLVAAMWLSFTIGAATGRVRTFFVTTGTASLITGANYFYDSLWLPGSLWSLDGILSYGIAFLGWGQNKSKIKEKEK